MVQGFFSMAKVWKLKAEASCKANVGGNPPRQKPSLAQVPPDSLKAASGLSKPGNMRQA